jgi:hypothetical protein
MSHKLRRTHSGHSAIRRLFASGISCHPSGASPLRRAADDPHEEQNTLFLSSPEASLIR